MAKKNKYKAHAAGKLDTMDRLEAFDKLSQEREQKRRMREKKLKGYATTKMDEV